MHGVGITSRLAGSSVPGMARGLLWRTSRWIARACHLTPPALRRAPHPAVPQRARAVPSGAAPLLQALAPALLRQPHRGTDGGALRFAWRVADRCPRCCSQAGFSLSVVGRLRRAYLGILCTGQLVHATMTTPVHWPTHATLAAAGAAARLCVPAGAGRVLFPAAAGERGVAEPLDSVGGAALVTRARCSRRCCRQCSRALPSRPLPNLSVAGHAAGGAREARCPARQHQQQVARPVGTSGGRRRWHRRRRRRCQARPSSQASSQAGSQGARGRQPGRRACAASHAARAARAAAQAEAAGCCAA